MERARYTLCVSRHDNCAAQRTHPRDMCVCVCMLMYVYVAESMSTAIAAMIDNSVCTDVREIESVRTWVWDRKRVRVVLALMCISL